MTTTLNLAANKQFQSGNNYHPIPRLKLQMLCDDLCEAKKEELTLKKASHYSKQMCAGM